MAEVAKTVEPNLRALTDLVYVPAGNMNARPKKIPKGTVFAATALTAKDIFYMLRHKNVERTADPVGAPPPAAAEPAAA